MRVYIIFVSEDLDFVQQLSQDLDQYNIDYTLGRQDTTADFDRLQKANTILAVLSEAAVNDMRFLATLEAATEMRRHLLALRISSISEMPSILKGVLPLNFSNVDNYEDVFETLLEDLSTSTQTQLLPEDIWEALHSSERQELIRGIELLGSRRQEFDSDEREYAQQLLRDFAFRDSDTIVRNLARTTLQLFGTDEPKTTPIPVKDILKEAGFDPDQTDRLNKNELAAKAKSRQTFPIWMSNEWRYLPIFGALLALAYAWVADEIIVIIPLFLVWLILPAFNTWIRGNSDMEWVMPAPLIGNGIVALILAGIGIFVGALIDSDYVVEILPIILLTVLQGVFIGWGLDTL